MIARNRQQTGEEVIGRETLKWFWRQKVMTQLDARLIH
jgi:type IV secretory pathway VirJ component